jgi:hypothetical protein
MSRGEEWLDFALPFTHSYQERVFRSWFGVPSCALPILWSWITTIQIPKKWGAIDLLMCLNFLKSPGNSWGEFSTRFLRSEKTAKKRLFQSLRIINEVLPKVYLINLCLWHFLIFSDSYQWRTDYVSGHIRSHLL